MADEGEEKAKLMTVEHKRLRTRQGVERGGGGWRGRKVRSWGVDMLSWNDYKYLGAGVHQPGGLEPGSGQERKCVSVPERRWSKPWGRVM